MKVRRILRSYFQLLPQTLTVTPILLVAFYACLVCEPTWAADSTVSAAHIATANSARESTSSDKANKAAAPTVLPGVGQPRVPKRQPTANLKAAEQILQSQELVFIENKGQFDKRVKFLVRGNAANLWLTNDGIVFDFQQPLAKGGPAAAAEKSTAINSPLSDRTRVGRSPKPESSPMERLVFKQKLVGTNSNPTIEAHDMQPGIYNYFLGSHPEEWATHVTSYKEVVYRDVWKGVDLKLFANGTNLEEEFIVHAGANPRSVQLAYEGIDSLSLADDGSLQVATAFGNILETPPHVYREVSGQPVAVSGSFRLGPQNSYSFDISKSNEQADLIIDPIIITSKTAAGEISKISAGKHPSSGSPPLFSTYLGGNSGESCGYDCGPTEQATGIAVDTAGNTYVAGVTNSTDFPTTQGAYEPYYNGSCSFVSEFAPLGKPLVYSTYICQQTAIAAIAVNAAGNAYVTGNSGGLAVTPNAFQSYIYGIFLTELSAAGDSLLYSTGYGAYGSARAIALDSSGRAYITGSRAVVPTTPNAYQDSPSGSYPSFLAVFDPSQSGQASFVYGSYLSSGSVIDDAYGIAVDSFNMAYVGGATTSPDFPVTPGALQTTYAGNTDAFLTKFNPYATDGPSSVLYSTYLGAADTDVAYCVSVDANGNAFIAGLTGSHHFPTTSGALVPNWGDFRTFRVLYQRLTQRETSWYFRLTGPGPRQA